MKASRRIQRFDKQKKNNQYRRTDMTKLENIGISTLAALAGIGGWLRGVTAANADLTTEDLRVYGTLTVAPPNSFTTNSWELYYPFSTNGAVADQSGNSNTGTVTGASWTNAAKVGGGMVFDGSGDYVTVANESNFDFGSSDFTICFWMNPDESSPATTRTVMSKYYTSGQRSWIVQYRTSGELRTDVCQNGSSGDVGVETTENDMEAGTWYHVVFVKSGTAGTFYVDGVPLSDNEATLYASVYNNSQPVRVGTYKSGAGSLCSFFKGALDEILVYKRALSSSEITELYLYADPPADAGVTCIPPGGDISMGSYTNRP